jgi:hypothetical protein
MLREGEIEAKRCVLRRFLNQPVAEIVQCGEPIFLESWLFTSLK